MYCSAICKLIAHDSSNFMLIVSIIVQPYVNVSPLTSVQKVPTDTLTLQYLEKMILTPSAVIPTIKFAVTKEVVLVLKSIF